ncbi:MAG: nitroreductase family protein [Coriobacteriia bacterium]|nr:nitroreductase family protein [Coriobacteriia bacterium]
MELMDAIRSRRSIRVFDGTPVAREVVDELVEAATYAPSRMNVQPWYFHVAMGESRARIAEVMAMTTSYLDEYLDVLGPEGVEHAAQFYAELGRAPVIIGIASPCTDDEHEARDYAISVGAALENLLLAAVGLGIGTCSISVPHWISDRLAEQFDIADGWQITSMIVLGHADEVPAPRERDTDVVTYLT